MFGVPLYYDDGTLMHGGMFFDVDVGIALRSGRLERQEMVRVEHYGKGAPDRATDFTRSRPVPAVTGAFISSEAAWFEKLGGFSEDYVFGHYEDADLCLKSFVNGCPVWLQDIKLWHLEGKGSTRRPVHEGGSIVNRWLFLSQWASVLADGLIGARPRNPAFATSAPNLDAPVRPNAARVPIIAQR
jgi:GT2 family glycosyltransferase